MSSSGCCRFYRSRYNRHVDKYTSTASFPCACLSKLPVEGLVKIVGTTVGIIGNRFCQGVRNSKNPKKSRKIKKKSQNPKKSKIRKNLKISQKNKKIRKSITEKKPKNRKKNPKKSPKMSQNKSQVLNLRTP